MKNSKYLFYAMAASLTFAGCSNEEFGYSENAVNGDMVSVEELNLVFGRTDAEAQTRAEWQSNNDGLSFLWNSATDAIGMVYTGQTGTTGVTNYNFTADSLQLASFKKKTDDQIRWTGFYKIGENAEDKAAVNAVYTKEDESEFDDDDLGTSAKAKFKTVNDAIMKGYYVAYYPYNEDYRNAGGPIPVVSPKEISVSNTVSNLQAVGNATYAYSAPVNVEAGKQVTQFDLKNLSSVMRIKIANEGDLEAAKNIKSAVLRTRGNDAFVVKGTLTNPSLEPDASVINVAEDGKTATLFVRYDASSYLELKKEQTATTKDTIGVYFPVLPTTLASDEIDIILIDESNMACVLDGKFSRSNVTLPAGRRINLTTKITEETKFDQSFVTTADELQAAINSAKSLGTPTTINLLGDITSDDLNMVGTGATDWKGGVTIVASAGSKLTLNNPMITTYNNITNGVDNSTWLTIDAPLAINGGTIEGCVEVKGETTVDGELKIGKANSASDYYWGKLKISGKATVNKGGKINSVYSWGVSVEKDAELIVAEGAEFVNGNFKFDNSGDKQYKSDLIIKGTMTVNGTLTDGGDTAIEGGKLIINGTATNNNKLDVKNGTIEINGTFSNKAATSGSNTFNAAGNVKIVTGTLYVAEDGKIYNDASLNCMGTFNNQGTFFDYVGSVYGGVPYNGSGIYACYVNSEKRLTEAYTRLNMYAADKTQKIILQKVSSLTPTTYELTDVRAKNVDFENEGDITISNTTTYSTHKIKSLTVTGKDATVTINANMMISGAASVNPITINENAKIVFNNDIDVRANGEIVNNGTFDLLPAADEYKLPATVYCTKADVTKGTWTNYPLVTSGFWTGW